MGSSVPGFALFAATSAFALMVAKPVLAQAPAPPASSGSPAPSASVPENAAAQPTIPQDTASTTAQPIAAPPASSSGPVTVPATPAPVPGVAPPAQVGTPTGPARGPERDANFLGGASPWVDLAFFNFSFDDRVDEFTNLGVQVGGYFWDHLRLSVRLVAPLEEVSDSPGYSYGTGGSPSSASFTRIKSRSVSVLYGASAGFAITNSRAFVFAPSLALIRTDVEDYGSAVMFALPFEWTTTRNMRVGFELELGRAIGGHVREICRSSGVSCGTRDVDRPGATAIVAQFYMGWAIGRL